MTKTSQGDTLRQQQFSRPVPRRRDSRPAPSPQTARSPFFPNRQPGGAFPTGHFPSRPGSQALGGGTCHCCPRLLSLRRGLGRNPRRERAGPVSRGSHHPSLCFGKEHLTYGCLLSPLGSELPQEVPRGQGLLFRPPGHAARGACDPTVPNHVTSPRNTLPWPRGPSPTTCLMMARLPCPCLPLGKCTMFSTARGVTLPRAVLSCPL